MNVVNKTNQYKKALSIIEHVLGSDGYQIDTIGKMATVSAILKMHFPEWIFVGFYRVTDDDKLIIGPYQGSVLACGTIRFGRGVCGQCAREQKNHRAWFCLERLKSTLKEKMLLFVIPEFLAMLSN